MSTKLEPRYLTPAQLAQLVGVSANAIRDGKAGTAGIPRVRFGRAIRFPKADVDRFLEQKDAEAESPREQVERVLSKAMAPQRATRRKK